jgi:hypothetical protein
LPLPVTPKIESEFDLNFVLTTTSKIHRRATTAHRTSLLPSTVVLSDFCSVAGLSLPQNPFLPHSLISQFLLTTQLVIVDKWLFDLLNFA